MIDSINAWGSISALKALPLANNRCTALHTWGCLTGSWFSIGFSLKVSPLLSPDRRLTNAMDRSETSTYLRQMTTGNTCFMLGTLVKLKERKQGTLAFLQFKSKPTAIWDSYSFSFFAPLTYTGVNAVDTPSCIPTCSMSAAHWHQHRYLPGTIYVL
jgi:hypothetical protein